MTRYALYASLPQYHRHLAPIAAELQRRGHTIESWAAQGGQAWGTPLADLGKLAETVIVASAIDAKRVNEIRSARTVVYVEHGAGQTYLPMEGERNAGFGYPGGPDLGHVDLFICPSIRVATLWQRTYPDVQIAVVGCPAIDWGKPGTPAKWDHPVVTFSAHWRCGVNPETWPAIGHYWPVIPDLARGLAKDGIELVGHAHPRYARRLGPEWAELGIRYEPDPDRVLAESSLLIMDSSSLMYEAAALDLPVLALNRPEYRRDVHHGLRFWSQVPGLQCDRPEDLAFMVDLALDDPADAQLLRREAALFTYTAVDGKASARAADAIENLKG